MPSPPTNRADRSLILLSPPTVYPDKSVIFANCKPKRSFMYTNKQIWSVSYPILLSLLAQNVINVTDTAFLGRVGEVALGASAMGGLFLYLRFYYCFRF